MDCQRCTCPHAADLHLRVEFASGRSVTESLCVVHAVRAAFLYGAARQVRRVIPLALEPAVESVESSAA